ncbi:MAG: DUF2147 domain-containing protein [Methyloceanibacter sp.]
MRHQTLAAAMGLLALAVTVPVSQSQAASADPTGIWRKVDQGERPGKIEISRCGTGNKMLCAKIVWLQDPLDSRGKPLHDVRNENPSMRGRPILGLPVFTGLTPTGPATWTGKIYNPEDGNTYSATLTMVSRSQINLKGCKAWLLCGQRTWVRTTLPKPEPEPQIEASAEPEAATVQPASAEAAAKPAPPTPEQKPVIEAEMLTPVPVPAEQERPGYRFLSASATAPAGLSGESVPSMFVLNKPMTSETAPAPADAAASMQQVTAPEAKQQSAAAEPAAAPLPGAEPKPKPAPAMQASVAPVPQTAPPSADETTSAPVPPDGEGTAEGAPTDNAGTAMVEEPPLTRRQKRLMRRQMRQDDGTFPWLSR